VVARTSVPHGAGEISTITVALRAPLALTPEQRMQAKRWRKTGLEIWEVAEEMGLPEEEVALALANIRTKRPNPPRISLNVSVAAAEKVKAMQRTGEALWQTVNRLLGIP
jgi:hypothetical protein